VHNATVRAVLYAKSLKAKHIGGLFFAADPEDVESIQGQWAEWDMDIALTSIDAPFRDISGPLLEEVRRDTTHKDSIVTVVLPELVVSESVVGASTPQPGRSLHQTDPAVRAQCRGHKRSIPPAGVGPAVDEPQLALREEK